MSKRSTKSFQYQLHQFMKARKGTMSYSTYHHRVERLTLMQQQLESMGYKIHSLSTIKQKHVQALVDHWKAKALSVGRMKNLLSDLRYLCGQMHRCDVVKSNADYYIGQRSYVAIENKAIINADFSQIADDHIRISLELQSAFGLRREECLKIMPHLADQGDHLWLKGSWTKGNIERTVPITAPQQRNVLDKAKAFVKKTESMIPKDRTYAQQLNRYNNLTKAQGWHNLHGLRHAYAQQKYRELTGWEPPINGGPQAKDLSPEQRAIDRQARLTISEYLGHSRLAVLKVYCG